MNSVSTSPVLKDKAGGAIAINHVMFCLNITKEGPSVKHLQIFYQFFITDKFCACIFFFCSAKIMIYCTSCMDENMRIKKQRGEQHTIERYLLTIFINQQLRMQYYSIFNNCNSRVLPIISFGKRILKSI